MIKPKSKLHLYPSFSEYKRAKDQHRHLKTIQRAFEAERDGRLGPEHEVDSDTDPFTCDEGGSSRRRGMDAEVEGRVQGSHNLHADEQVQRQRLVPYLRRQSRRHSLDR